ncbi:MAG: FtsX-like permease family protein [Armatimonadetes bacterium]|nr:FtsX-like permease family protein [Armatimonadota bacterium]
MIDAKRLAKAATATAVEGVHIQRQITLPWKDAARISIRNVTLRLGRAAITGAGVVLGIAFLMSVWTGKVVTEGLEREQAKSAFSITQVGEGETAPGLEEMKQEKQSRAARQAWLVVMSLLVCGVGITNSMLMSVTERFREIGTMKCLGALDSFIVRLFLIESVVLGFLGSVVGALLGHVIMLIVFMIREGASVAAKMNWLHMGEYFVLAIGLGCVLAFVAAVAPAVRAAQMPPAAALATEV